jgi:protein-disulfide isomerase
LGLFNGNLAAAAFGRRQSRATQCANRVGRFAEFTDLVYAKQDSLGLKGWNSYASEAGVRDTTAFARCLTETEPIARIDSGLSIGHRIGVHGTPTVLVNGWRFASVPTEAELLHAISAVASGASPFLASRKGP